MDLTNTPHIINDDCIFVSGDVYRDQSTEHFWAKVFDLYYEKISNTPNAVLDTTVWRNSYDGQPFSKVEMDEWLQNAIDQMKPYLNSQASILEIGSGNGLIFSLIIESIGSYTGTDIAPHSLTSISESFLGKTHKEKISLYQLPADKIDSIEGKYDLIIVNSVMQYFPDLNYFFDFLKRCESKLSNNGIIFLGDIRSFDLADEFYNDIAKFKYPNNPEKVTLYASRTKVKENELLYSPAIFKNLPKAFPWIKSVTVQNKKSKFQNEMTRFRFDVILFKDNSGTTQEITSFDISKLSNRISSTTKKITHNNREYDLISLNPELFGLIKYEK